MPIAPSSSDAEFSISSRTATTPQILVVEDEVPLRNLLVATLSERLFEVVVAGDGMEALEVLEGHPSIQLVLSDVLMPRMNGYELAAHALVRRPELKLLMMTAYATQMPPPALLQAREIRMLRKPFDIVDMCDVVEGMLSRP